MVHNPAVAAFRDIVIQLEFECAELFGCNNVTGVMRIDTYQRAIFDLPTRLNSLLLEIMPAIEVLAVEEQLPPSCLLRGAQCVISILGPKAAKGTGHEQY